MKRKAILVLAPVLLLGAVVFSTADARPAAGNTTWPLSLITRPCASIGVQGPGGGPPRVVCMGVTGRPATVNVPTPWLSDRAPEMSLVSIPTFFNLEWDPGSLDAQDSAPLTLSYPIGNPTDKLINVRVQLRLRAWDYPAQGTTETSFTMGNVALETPDSLYLVNATDTRNTYYQFACTPDAVAGLDPSNPLLSIGPGLGGYPAGCASIQEELGGVGSRSPVTYTTGFRDTQRYPEWGDITIPQFLGFTPFASIYGAGMDRGSPAFQVIATTRFAVEARVVWDVHQERREDVEIDCQWSYRNNYDFIDWSRWPDPIYCRRNVTVSWPTFCERFDGCPYGNPNDWWIPYVPALEVQAIRLPDGTYGTTYDFVSVQSQALLTAP